MPIDITAAIVDKRLFAKTLFMALYLFIVSTWHFALILVPEKYVLTVFNAWRHVTLTGAQESYWL